MANPFNLKERVEEKLNEIHLEVLKVAQEEAKKQDIDVHLTKEHLSWRNPSGYEDFYVRRNGEKEPISLPDQLNFLSLGIWPGYYLEASYYDQNITRKWDYNGSFFYASIRTNFCLDAYVLASKPSLASYEGEIINPSSVLFLREEGITTDLWKKMVKKDENMKGFCLWQTGPEKKERILYLRDHFFKDDVCQEVKFNCIAYGTNDFGY